MHTKLALLAALVLLGSPIAASGGDEPPADLELASLAVTDGIRGGIAPRTPRVRLAVRYDRVARAFRVVRRRDGPEGDEAWVAELEAEQFRALLELAVSAGLPALPLEDPPSCTDVYDRDRQVLLDYGSVRWANGAPEACRQWQSRVMPSEEERRRFDEVVERVERAVDALPLRRGGGVELRRIPFLGNVRVLQTYRRVMEHVLADPVRHRLDLERMWAGEGGVSFCWRGRPPCEPGGDSDFVIDGAGKVIPAPPGGVRSVFEPFVPIETGTTLDEVVRRLGQPDVREERADGSLVVTYSTCQQLAPGKGPILLPARLRFEDGRVSAP